MDPSEKSKPWYYDYEAKIAAVHDAKANFRKRCIELGLLPETVLLNYTREIVANAVHESNWQEGVEVAAGRTRELSDIVFADFETSKPGLNLSALLESHKALVVEMKERGMTENDIITLNLSATYKAVTWLLIDFIARYQAILAKLLDRVSALIPSERMTPELKASITTGKAAAATLFSNEKMGIPLTHEIETGQEFLEKAGRYDDEKDLHMLENRHVHFLHRLLFTGIFPPNRLGAFRKCSVNIGRQDLIFPPPEIVTSLMDDFVKTYPLHAAFGQAKDTVMEAAKFSHRFVAIHPYNDGNGRISRALMNLVLCGQHPFVALKATTRKSRSRYYYSLRRADRGDLKPLASLIALSLIETYNRILGSLGSSQTRPG